MQALTASIPWGYTGSVKKPFLDPAMLPISRFFLFLLVHENASAPTLVESLHVTGLLEPISRDSKNIHER